MGVATSQPTVDVALVRRWLALLRRPDRLATAGVVPLLEAHGLLPEPATAAATGKAAAALIVETIESLRPDGDSREKQLPYLVLRTCFVDGAKLFQAAGRLGMSERQLSRERAWAIELLTAELNGGQVPAEPQPSRRVAAASMTSPALPRISDYLPRPDVSAEVNRALAGGSLVTVTGAAGVGKTSLVAEVVAALDAPVFWFRVRRGVNDSLAALLLDLADYLAARGVTSLREHLDGAASVDVAVATRHALRALAEADDVLVVDDLHLVPEPSAWTEFLAEIAERSAGVRCLAVTRMLPAARRAPGLRVVVAPLSLAESAALLAPLGLPEDVDVAEIHAWTSGIPHLLMLAAAWLREVGGTVLAERLSQLQGEAEVREFLLSTVTGLLESDDRSVLEAASLFRSRFTDDALAWVSGRSRGEVSDTSLRLVNAYIATRSRDGDCAFFHASLRDYVYERLAPERAAELHARAATWFSTIGDHGEATHHAARSESAASSPS